MIIFNLNFFLLVTALTIILVLINYILSPDNPYKEKLSVFECGFHSFLGQNRSPFTISFFIFALLFLLFDLEILLVYPYTVSSYNNSIYGLIIMLIFLLLLTLGFIFELGKQALKIDSRQIRNKFKIQENTCLIYGSFFKWCLFKLKFIWNIFIKTIYITFSKKNLVKIVISILLSLATRIYINVYFNIDHIISYLPIDPFWIFSISYMSLLNLNRDVLFSPFEPIKKNGNSLNLKQALLSIIKLLTHTDTDKMTLGAVDYVKENKVAKGKKNPFVLSMTGGWPNPNNPGSSQPNNPGIGSSQSGLGSSQSNNLDYIPVWEFRRIEALDYSNPANKRLGNPIRKKIIDNNFTVHSKEPKGDVSMPRNRQIHAIIIAHRTCHPEVKEATVRDVTEFLYYNTTTSPDMSTDNGKNSRVASEFGKDCYKILKSIEHEKTGIPDPKLRDKGQSAASVLRRLRKQDRDDLERNR